MPGHATRTVLVDATGQTPVTVDSSGNLTAVLAAGTAAIGNIGGQVAAGAAVSGNPVMIGFEGRTTTGGQVSNGQVKRAAGTTDGRLVVKPYAIAELEWQYAAAASGIVNTTTAVTFKAAHATERNYVTTIQISHATLGAATELAIRDGAGGTVIWRTLLHTTAMPSTTYCFPTPLKGTAATLLEVVTLTAVTGGVYFNAQGFTSP